MGCSPSSEGII